jgi:hypothetical protein
MSDAAKAPHFNHVALTVPAEALDEEGRRRLLDFYGEVFGWSEMPTMTLDRERLVFRAYSNDQFVFVVASDEPMRCSGNEHVGLQVATPEALDEMLDRARKYAERDAEVEISERGTEDYEAVVLHNVYIRYRLPMSIELQCYEWAEGFDPSRTA